MKAGPAAQRNARQIAEAIEKTEDIQGDLASAEKRLKAANTVFAAQEGPASKAVMHDAVQMSLDAEVEVHDAAVELEAVTELLVDTQKKLAASRGEGRSGEGASSVLDHLRSQGHLPKL